MCWVHPHRLLQKAGSSRRLGLGVAPICISRRSKEMLPSLRELRLVSSRQASTLGAETKVRAKGQHQLEVLREAVRGGLS